MSRASLALLLALGLPAQTPATPAPKPVEAKPAAQTGVPKAEDRILAKVGDDIITQSDFDAAISQMPQQQQMQILMVQGGREEFIKRLAEYKILAVKGKRLNLGATPEFMKSLARDEERLLAEAFVKQESAGLQQKMEIKDEDVKAFYDAHPAQWKQPELVSVRHILVAVKANPEAKEGISDAEAKVRIAKIQRELKAGKKFDDLAKKYSDDPGSKEKGGLYPDADPSLWVPEFAKAAKEQPVGLVGKPIKTQFGYHLVKVESRKPARQVPFEEAKAQAREGATRARQEQVWTQFMDGLKKEIPVVIVPPTPPAQAIQPAAKPVEEPKPAEQAAPTEVKK